MWPGPVVVVEELGEHLPEVALIHDQQPIQALTPDGLDQPLQMGVRSRRSLGRTEYADAFGVEHGIEAIRVLGVSIANQKADRRLTILEIVSHVARCWTTQAE